MKRISLLALALAATTLSTASWAGSDSGPYIGGSVGTSEISESGIDDSDSAYKIFGGYNFGVVPFLNLAAEAAYVDLGEWEGDGNAFTVEAQTWTLTGLVGFDMGPVGLFAKAGYASWESDLRSSLGNASEDGNDTTWGLGAKLQLGSIAVRAEYEVFDLDGTDIDFYSVGAAFTF